MSRNLKFFFIGLGLPFLFLGLHISKDILEKYFYAQISQPFQDSNPPATLPAEGGAPMTFVKIPERPNLKLQAKAALSVKITETGREKVLFKKNINQPLPIASLTKLMTAIIVLENYDLEKTSVTISQEAASQENVPNYGNLDKEIGKKFSLERLLDLMLIYSSNDAAWALAEEMGIKNFVEKMNQKAQEIGLENTHFVNPTGLDPENLSFEESPESFNYSTAKDLLKLAQYILREHPLIFEITQREPFYQVENGIFDIFLTKKVVGGKTGYTDEAGGCILFIFKNEKGNLFINLVLGAPSTSARIEEMQKIINWLNP